MRVTLEPKRCSLTRVFDQAYGARYLERTIQKMLEDPLAEEILQGRFGEGSRIRVTKKGEELVFDDERREGVGEEVKRSVRPRTDMKNFRTILFAVVSVGLMGKRG